MEQVDLTHPITEDDIANFLLLSPDFFERHAGVLATVQLTSPHGNRAVGLQQRQAEMLREKIRLLESRIVEMIGHAHDNAQLADKLEQWACELLRVEQPLELPERLVAELMQRFELPQAVLKLWEVDARFADAPFVQGIGEDAKIFASSLSAPFCGVNPGFAVVSSWLEDPAAAVSLALIPLRWRTRAEAAVVLAAARRQAASSRTAAEQQGFGHATRAALEGDGVRVEPTPNSLVDAGAPASTEASSTGEPACGLLLLASPDPKRFQAGMGTEYLERLADLAGAALSRLRPAAV